MRIRKNISKFLGLAIPYSSRPSAPPSDKRVPPSSSNASIGASSEVLCQLNQSPWDVYPNHQFFKTTFKDVESLQCLMETQEALPDANLEKNKGILGSMPKFEMTGSKTPLSKRVDDITGVTKRKAAPKRDNNKTILCKKNDGKKWFCKRPAQLPHPLCAHHLSQSRFYYNKEKQGSGSEVGSKTKRQKQKEAGDISSSIYYYDGHVPLRGKRRGTGIVQGGGNAGHVDQKKMDENGTLVAGRDEKAGEEVQNHEVVSSLTGEEKGGICKNSARKPVKYRSLNSFL